MSSLSYACRSLSRDQSLLCYANDSVRVTLEQAGLTSVDALFSFGEPLDEQNRHRGSRHPQKEVVTATLQLEGRTQRIYIKRQWKPQRWIPRVSDVRRGLAFVPSPVAEWCGLRQIHAAGLLAAEPLALVRERRWNRRSAIVTAAVPPVHSLTDMLISGTIGRMCEGQVDSLASAIVAVVNQLHGAGLCWRSMKAKHLYPGLANDGRWQIWLIDCEGVFRSNRPNEQRKDRERFIKSIRRCADHGLLEKLVSNLAACGQKRSGRSFSLKQLKLKSGVSAASAVYMSSAEG